MAAVEQKISSPIPSPVANEKNSSKSTIKPSVDNLSTSTASSNKTQSSAEEASNAQGPQQTSIESYEWVVRPCFLYKEEYTDCKSFSARFHQYFTEGKIWDCQQWKDDYTNCTQWTKSKDPEALKKLVESERQRMRLRLRAHLANDIWEHREEPPKNWNEELPQNICKQYENSLLKTKSEEIKSGKESLSSPLDEIAEESSCSIM